MASVAPTVTSTSVSGSSSRPYQARWCAATARRSSGMPLPGGYWLRPSRMAATATSRSSSGPSVSGKPWPRLTEPVAVASSDMVAKMVVVNGRQAPGQIRVPAGTATIVPTAIGRAYRRVGPCSASPTTTCTAGWTGGAGPTTIVAAIAYAATPTSSCSRRPGRPRGTTEAGRRRRRPGALGYQIEAHTLGRRAPHPPPARGAAPPGWPGRRGPIATGRSTWTACARSRRGCGPWRAGRRPSRGRGASPCSSGRSSRSRRRGSCT